MTQNQLTKIYKLLSDIYDDTVGQVWYDAKKAKRIDNAMSIISGELVGGAFNYFKN